MKVSIGKAKIEIQVEGCVDCGTRWSFGWHEAKSVPVKIGKMEKMIVVSRCGSCEKKRMPLFHQG